LAVAALAVAMGASIARPRPRKLTAVIFLAWVFRIALLALLTAQSQRSGTGVYYLRSGDAAAYHRLAQSVLETDSWAVWGNLPSYTYVVAAMYKIFGPDPNVANILNIGISLIIVPYIYELGRECGGSRAGLVAAVAYSIYPSMILWSVSMVKDVWIVLAVVICARATASISRGQSYARDSVGLVVGCGLLAFFRYQYVLIVPVGLLLSIALSGKRHRRAILASVVVALVMMLFVSMSAIGIRATELVTESLEEGSWLTSQELALAGGSGISALSGVPARYRWIAQLPFVILAPFPWKWLTTGRGINRLSGLETAMMYVCYYVIVAGRRRWAGDASSGALIAYAFAVYLAVSFSLPNLGSIYRYRIAGNVLLLPVAIAVLVRWKGGKKGGDV